jgi:tetratricopeptide (TPR) repeat protein
LDDLYVTAKELSDHGKTELAWKLMDRLLRENPKDVRALTMASHFANKQSKFVEAYYYAQVATDLMPKDAAAWTNYGHAASKLWLIQDAERAYQKALQLSKTQHDFTVLWINLGALYIDTGDYETAQTYLRKVLNVDPTHRNALTNLGFCQLALADWEHGWKGYRGTIGSDWRKKVVYKNEPEWDGTPDKVVALYADQGLGDEIVFASMLGDVAKHCRKVILDCDGRLAALFARSFPQIKVYGTRTKQEKWAKEDRDIEASLPLGQVGEYVRTSAESFPRAPYLLPCPIRHTQWANHFRHLARPVIGIAWSGGASHTGQRERLALLKEWLPLFEAFPQAQFVSLQYTDAQKEIDEFRKEHPVDLVQYRWATLTDDYDDTAALVAALDCVVGVPTSVVHLAGALGVPTIAMKSRSSCWKYSAGLPFHPCELVEWQGSWHQTIQAAVPLCASSLGTTPANPSPTTFFSIHSSDMPAVPLPLRH